MSRTIIPKSGRLPPNKMINVNVYVYVYVNNGVGVYADVNINLGGTQA